MPSVSDKQRKYIFYLRGKYKSKENTPEKEKWIWESGWNKIKETTLTSTQINDIRLWRKKYGSPENTPESAQWIWNIELEENKMRKRYIEHFKKNNDKKI